MSSSSFPIELFDYGRWTVGFIRQESGLALRWSVRGFIRLHLCPPCCFPVSDVLLWTPSQGRAKAGWPAKTYIQQLCAYTGCNLEDIPEAMDDREGWRETVRDNLCVFFDVKVILVEEHGPVGSGFRIHWLHLCREVKLPQRVSYLWH